MSWVRLELLFKESRKRVGWKSKEVVLAEDYIFMPTHARLSVGAKAVAHLAGAMQVLKIW